MNQRQPIEQPKPLSAKFPRYSIWTLLRTMAVLALGYVLLLAYLHYQGDTEIQQLFGGSAGLATLKHADRIEAYRIDQRANPNNWENVGVSDFPIMKGPISLSQSDAEALQRT